MSDEIIEDAIAAGAIVIKFGMQNDEATQYTFIKSKLTKFAALRDARKSEQPDAVKDAIEKACDVIHVMLGNSEIAEDLQKAIREMTLKGE